MTYPFLSPVTPEAPAGLIAKAQRLATPRVALVCADAVNPLEGIKEAQEAGLAEPVLIGETAAIKKAAEEIEYDISGFRVIEAHHDEASPKAAELARNGEVDAIMKGQIHTSDFLKGLLPSKAGLREQGVRCGHVFHVTAPGNDRALLITDAALNTQPDIAIRQDCLAHAVALSQKLGVERPRAALLAPTEEVMDAVPNTGESAEIVAWAKTALPQADVAGPMAMDLILSKEAARIKSYDSPVAGDADIILTPDITSGNAVFKLFALGMGCCVGGLVLGAKVPLLLTSRSQGAAARIASAALGVVAAG